MGRTVFGGALARLLNKVTRLGVPGHLEHAAEDEGRGRAGVLLEPAPVAHVVAHEEGPDRTQEEQK